MASGLSCGFTMTTAAPILSVPNSAPTNPGPSGRAIMTRCSGSTPLSVNTWPNRFASAWPARLAASSHEAVLLPAIAYTAAEFAAGFPGTVSLRPATVTALLVELARSLTRHGLSLLAVANAHLDPAHLGAIESAVTQIRHEDGARIVFPDVTKRPWAVRLTDEFRSGACHAGQYESSIVLAARPELVREALRRSLPANPRSLSGALRAGQTSFEQAGGPRAYFGSPAEARADEGARTIAVLGAILEEAVLAELGR